MAMIAITMIKSLSFISLEWFRKREYISSTMLGGRSTKIMQSLILADPPAPVEDPIGYLPVAVVSWNTPDLRRRVMQVLKSEKLYPTSDEAGAVALEKAKAWVERHALER